jgi:hypothetical protein
MKMHYGKKWFIASIKANQCHNNMLIYPTINQKKLIDANLRNNLRDLQ